MASDVLPSEILTEIFSRLPPQSLLRFRSTSESLKSIIDSHNFTNLHLKNSLNLNLILGHKTNLFHLHFPNLTTAIPLNHPLSNANGIKLFGSCNGLLCISSKAEITFWNPNIRKHRIIPNLPIPIPQSETKAHYALFTYGFGFDPLSSDYKLIRISWFIDLTNFTFDSYVSLFTSKTNSWKVLPSIEYVICYALTMGVFVENSLHWMMVKKPDGLHQRLIFAFNLTLEVFNEVPFPDEIRGEEVICNRSFEINVADLGGCLCLIVNYQTTKIDVWVMKEYGCKDSWCKLFTLMGSCFVLPVISLIPLGYSSDGKKLLFEVNHKKLVWYDLKSEEVNYIEGIPNFDEAMICVGSLVLPSFPVENCTKKENRTSKSKRRDDFLSRGFKLTL
ncbi:F-box protein CPR1 [Medicago truncatula]|uniref:F-box protein interaction domain protein n=1 Tax=Medicago truncatula TaxID=3880 RepID=A0A072V642_MEDTR|nr:F-box protein CPR1 [Medicago truncatula]KEH37096.1 F-box protein interaction domain protein [Medicago truncatula]